MDSFGMWLRSARKEAGLTQAGVGELLGVTQNKISMWERGKAQPSTTEFEMLVEALGNEASSPTDPSSHVETVREGMNKRAGLGEGSEKVESAVRGEGRLELSQLESHLWEAANILRGSPVDRTDWKSYILPLLFFKRICDVWDEERDEMMKQYGQVYAADFRFKVLDDKCPSPCTEHTGGEPCRVGCHWESVRGVSKHVGKAIRDAMRGIEQANQDKLLGVFGDASWTNKERLPDDLLKDLLEHFSKLPLGNKAVQNDVMGDAYEYLIKKFADSTNKKAGEFYTPRSVVRLMVDILEPKEGESIYDPACGTGGMLLAAVEHVRATGGDPRTFFGKLFGQEKNLTTASVARMNLQLHGVEEVDIRRGDTLRRPAFVSAQDQTLQQFDVVLANPPFSLKDWGREVWESDPWGRNFAGLPKKKSGDFAWVQHMVKSMAEPLGRMAVVLPLGALFHAGVEGKIRNKLLEEDRIESVIALGANLFYGTGVPACIIVCRHGKPEELTRQVYFVDASDQLQSIRNQNLLSKEHVAAIAGWYRPMMDRPGRSRLVPLEELRVNGGSLYPALYIWNDNALGYASKGAASPPRRVDQAMRDLKQALRRAQAAEDALRRELTERGGQA